MPSTKRNSKSAAATSAPSLRLSIPQSTNMSENAGGGAASATSAGTSAGVSQSGAAEDGGGDSAYQSPASDAATCVQSLSLCSRDTADCRRVLGHSQAGVERFIEAINCASHLRRETGWFQSVFKVPSLTSHSTAARERAQARGQAP